MFLKNKLSCKLTQFYEYLKKKNWVQIFQIKTKNCKLISQKKKKFDLTFCKKITRSYEKFTQN